MNDNERMSPAEAKLHSFIERTIEAASQSRIVKVERTRSKIIRSMLAQISIFEAILKFTVIASLLAYGGGIIFMTNEMFWASGAATVLPTFSLLGLAFVFVAERMFGRWEFRLSKGAPIPYRFVVGMRLRRVCTMK